MLKKIFLLLTILVCNIGFSQTKIALNIELDGAVVDTITEDENGIINYSICRGTPLHIKPILLNENGYALNDNGYTIKIFTDANDLVSGCSCPNSLPPYLLNTHSIPSGEFYDILQYYNNYKGFCFTNRTGAADGGGTPLNPNYNTFYIQTNDGAISTRFKLTRYSSGNFNAIESSTLYDIDDADIIPTITDAEDCHQLRFSDIRLKFNDANNPANSLYSDNMNKANYLIEKSSDNITYESISVSDTLEAGSFYRFRLKQPTTSTCTSNWFTIKINSLSLVNPVDVFVGNASPNGFTVCKNNLNNNNDEIIFQHNMDADFLNNLETPASASLTMHLSKPYQYITGTNGYPFYRYTSESLRNIEITSDNNNDIYYTVDSDNNAIEIHVQRQYLYNFLTTIPSLPLGIKHIYIFILYNHPTNTNQCLQKTAFSEIITFDNRYITPYPQNFLLQDFTNGLDLDEDGDANENELTTNTILHLFKKFQIDKLYSANFSMQNYDDLYNIKMFDSDSLEITPDDSIIDELFHWENNVNSQEFNRKKYYFDIESKDTICYDTITTIASKVPFDIGIFDVPELEQTGTVNPEIMYVCDNPITVSNLNITTNPNNHYLVYIARYGGNPLNPTDTLENGTTYYISQVGALEEGFFTGYYPTLQNGIESQSAKRISITIIYSCCPQPTLQPITEYTDTTATLNWTVNEQEGLWQIEYGFSGFTQGEGSTVTTSINPFTVNGLLPANSYDFYIRAICNTDPNNDEEDNMSLWDGPQTITTDCANCTSFKPEPNKKYVLSAWVKEDHSNITTTSFNINTEYIKEMLNDLVLKYQTDQIILDGYTNAGLDNLKSHNNLYSSSLNANAAIYDFGYSVFRGYRFKFSDNPFAPYHYFKVNLPLLGSTNGSIVNVSIDENAADQTSFVLDIDFDNDGTSDYNQLYNFEDNIYRSTVTSSTSNQVMNYNDTSLKVTFFDGTDALIGTPNQVEFNTSGDIIDGWQRIQGEFTIPVGTVKLNIDLINNFAGDAFFDDVRVFPVDGNMKSFVYDQQTQRLMAELDENNYATFYEYDKEGGLIRVKKETEKGVFTIQETRSGNVKK